ncbi:MAG: WD40 repeat domain-containing protein [Saprospiraceae bacterium]|nr:WD40 repeat domain-containing protein [Saprospiraceae bacterium]
MKIKKFHLLLIFTLGFVSGLPAQDCFDDFMKRGIDAYGLFQFQQAIDLFNAAKICPDNSEDQVQEIDNWISKANNGYINEITKARDEALVLQKEAVKQARFSEANRLAYLAAEELEKRNIEDALLLAFMGLDMIEDEPLLQVKQVFGDVVASSHALSYKGAGKPILDSDFLPDGRFWSRGAGQSLTFWGADGRVDTMLASNTRIMCTKASPDGQYIAVGFEKGDVDILDAFGNRIGQSRGTGDEVTDISFAHDGSLLAASYRTGKVKILSSNGTLQAETLGKAIPIKEGRFSADGKFIIIRSASSELQIIDTEAKPIETIQHKKHIYQFRLSPDQQKILTCSADSTARLSDFAGQILATLRHPAKVHKAIFSPDGQRMLTAALDHNIRFWDLTGKLLWTLKGNESTIESIQFAPDGQYFLSFSRGNVVNLWNSEGQPVKNLDRHTGSILCADFSPDSKFILTTSADQTVKLWDITGQLLMNADQYSGSVTSGKFSADGKDILTASHDGNLTVLENPVDVFKNLQMNPPMPTEDQQVRFGISPTQ